ncbi:MAG TPA: hypothetical protein VK507_25520 [Iamia sp.]|nr:hypothetical protein [Iamia sp.]
MTTTTTPSDTPAVDEPLAGFALRAVPLAAAGWLLGGWVGLAAAVVGVGSTFRRPPTLVAAAAPVALVVAALATVIEVPVDGDALRSSFADDRPTAATAGLVAALFALTAVVTLAVRDRAPAPPAVAAAAAPRAPGLDRQALVARAREWAPIAGIVLAAALALALLAPGVPGATDDVAANVRLGMGWATTTDDGGVVVDGTEPPLAVIVAAVAPGGAGAWTALAGAGATAAAAAFVSRRAGRRAVLLAAAGTALGLVVVRADLAAALAAALIGAALLAGDPEGRTPVSAALAGVAFGAAVLAFPVLGLALPLVVAALAVHPRTRDVTVAHGVAGLLGAVLVVAPWQRWLVDRFGTWSPAAEVQVPLSSALAVLVLLAAIAAPLLTPRPAKA